MKNKNITIWILVLILTGMLVVSCNDKPDDAIFWNGSTKEFNVKEPVCAILTLDSGEYKKFTTKDELRIILDGLLNPKEFLYNPNLQGEELVIHFLDCKYRLYYHLDSDEGRFVGPRGKDKDLYLLVIEKEVSSSIHAPMNNVIEDPNATDAQFQKLKEQIDSK